MTNDQKMLRLAASIMGKKGGVARMASMTPEERRENARRAGLSQAASIRKALAREQQAS